MLSRPIDSGDSAAQPVVRVRIWYAALIIVFALFLVRLFYLQIIRYDHYKNSALSDQLKQYEIPASRGRILAHSGGGDSQAVPVVLNQKLYLVYADPLYIKNAPKVAADVARITGGNTGEYEKLMTTKDSRYAILAKKVTEDMRSKILALKYPGIGAQQQEYRTYPQGTLASQVLGFVNDAGTGVYGVEQSLNKQLAGQPGELKAITDVHGVPLAASSGNTLKPAVPGKDLTLTIDLAMQKQTEKILADGVAKVGAQAGTAVVLDAKTGAVKAMANVPTYDPAKYFDVDDPSVFNNPAVTRPIEVGSIMKPLTTAAALNQGVITPSTTYYDPFQVTVDGFKITNIEEDGTAGVKSIADILNLSLNTGVTWELKQMGGGAINQKARSAWYDYMSNRFRFGKQTGIEQGGPGYEASGLVPSPNDNGAGIDLTYANTTFGQAMTATPLQMASAMAAVVNGGTYYQPHVVEGTPKVLKSNVVSQKVSQEMVPLMQYVVDKHNITPAFDQSKYVVGGKTGTAQIEQNGKYLENDFNGTYLGFVGGSDPQYIIAVFMIKPKVGRGAYAGTAAAQPVFASIGHMLIDNSYVLAKR